MAPARPSIAGAVRASITESLAQAEARAKRGGCCTTAKTNKLNDEFVFLRLPIRVLGVVLIVFSILEFGVGGFCYSYLSSNNFVGAGAFWAGLTYLILGVLSVHMRTKAVAIAAIIMCFVAWVVGLGAVGLDGTFSTLINNKLACSQMISGTGYGPKYSDYGNAKSYTAADVCYFQAYPNSQNNICYCSASVIPTTDISASPTCINLVLNPKVASGSCGDVFVKFGPALKASAGLCGFLVFVRSVCRPLSFVLSFSLSPVCLFVRPSLPSFTLDPTI